MAVTEKDKTTIPGVHPEKQKVVNEGRERLLGLHDATARGSFETYSGGESSGQLSDSEQRPSEEDIQRAELGPRGEPDKESPATMTPQRAKKTPRSNDPGHTA